MVYAHLENSKHEKELDVTTNNRLNFAMCLVKMTKNANNKEQKSFIFSSLVKSQMFYYPLI